MLSDQTTPATPKKAVTPRHALLENLIEIVHRHLSEQFLDFTTRVAAALVDGDIDGDVREIQARIRAGNLLRSDHYAYLSLVKKELEKNLRREIAELAPGQKAKPRVADLGLSLVPYEEMDSKVTLGAIAKPFEVQYSDVLATLNVRLAFLLDRDILRTNQNPFRPDVMLGALQHAWLAFNPDEEATGMLLTLLKPDLFMHLSAMFDELNETLQRKAEQPGSVDSYKTRKADTHDASSASPARKRKQQAELAQQLRQFFAGSQDPVADAAELMIPDLPDIANLKAGSWAQGPAQDFQGGGNNEAAHRAAQTAAKQPLFNFMAQGRQPGAAAFAQAPISAPTLANAPQAMGQMFMGSGAPGQAHGPVMAYMPSGFAMHGGVGDMQPVMQAQGQAGMPANMVAMPMAPGMSGMAGMAAQPGVAGGANSGGAMAGTVLPPGLTFGYLPAGMMAGSAQGVPAQGFTHAQAGGVAVYAPAGASGLLAMLNAQVAAGGADMGAGAGAGISAAGVPGSVAGVTGVTAATLADLAAGLAGTAGISGAGGFAGAADGAAAGATVFPGLASLGAAPNVFYLPTLKQTAPQGTLTRADESTIDLLSAVFDTVFRDQNISQEIRELMRFLQIPVLKAALVDKDFFFQDAHPARRLIDLLSRMGWEQRKSPDDPLFQAMQRSVERVGRDHDQELSVFAEAVNELEASLQAEESAAATAIAEPIKAALKQEKMGQAAKSAKQAVAMRIGTGEVVAVVEAFLENKWVSVLTLAYSVEDEKPGAVKNATQTMDDLVWSVKPKITPEERKALISKLPKLLSTLNKWLDIIKWQDAERLQFFAELAECHASIVRAPIELSPDRQVELAMEAAQKAAERRIALEAEAAAKPATPDLPLDDDAVIEVDSLARGVWLEFDQDDDSVRKVKLAWISPLRTLYIFSTSSRQEAFSLSGEELAQRFRDQKVRIFRQEGVVARALSQVMGQAAVNDASADGASSAVA